MQRSNIFWVSTRRVTGNEIESIIPSQKGTFTCKGCSLPFWSPDFIREIKDLGKVRASSTEEIRRIEYYIYKV